LFLTSESHIAANNSTSLIIDGSANMSTRQQTANTPTGHGVFEGGGVVAIIVLVTSPLITLDEDSSIGNPFIVKFVTNLATLPRNVTSALMLSMPIRL
jgi:hypothetical protein